MWCWTAAMQIGDESISPRCQIGAVAPGASVI
jgi:hypothetical protein